AISTRKVLSGAVTDVLVLRGDDNVVQNTVNNPGAEFSERGFTRLVNRAEGNDVLATCIGLRPNVPRHVYLKLLAKASETPRGSLLTERGACLSRIPATTAFSRSTAKANCFGASGSRGTAAASSTIRPGSRR
ncbi:MAG TPA: DUF2336 domain-containing protein, partial [Nitrospirota bacterium]